MTQWQPIETAPRDGTIVLLWGGKPHTYGTDEFVYVAAGLPWAWPKERPVSAWFEQRDWRFCSYDSGYYGEYNDPTHWMPLPEAPQ